MTTWQLSFRKLKVGKKSRLFAKRWLHMLQRSLFNLSDNFPENAGHFYYKASAIEWLTAWHIISNKTFFQLQCFRYWEARTLGHSTVGSDMCSSGKTSKITGSRDFIYIYVTPYCLGPYDISSNALITFYVNDHGYFMSLLFFLILLNDNAYNLTSQLT